MSTKDKTVSMEEKSLIIKIDYSWSAEDFGTLFNSVNQLYQYYSILNGFTIHYNQIIKDYPVKSGIKFPEIDQHRRELYYSIVGDLNYPNYPY